MSYVYINREIYPNQLVQDDPLDDNYAKGYSYDDYINGNPAPWIELGEEQLAFKEANPKATVKEIIEAKLDDSRLLNEEKSAKYEEIRTYENNNLHEFFLDDQINWKDGVGEVTDQPLTVSPGSGTGSAPVSFGSVMNNGLDRTLELEITTPKGVKKTLTVNQEGCRQAYITSDGKRWLTSDNRVYGVLKSDAPCECIGDCP